MLIDGTAIAGAGNNAPRFDFAAFISERIKCGSSSVVPPTGSIACLVLCEFNTKLNRASGKQSLIIPYREVPFYYLGVVEHYWGCEDAGGIVKLKDLYYEYN